MTFAAVVAAAGVSGPLWLLPAAAGTSAAAAAEVITRTFTFTGAEQTMQVPAGVTTIRVVAAGGHGAAGLEAPPDRPGGSGALIAADLPLSPSAGPTTLHILVGGNGTSGDEFEHAGGWNGGGSARDDAGSGGGATEVRLGATIASQLLIAGGGGGGAGDVLFYPGGAGGNGGLTGQPGGDGRGSCTGLGGHGAAQTGDSPGGGSTCGGGTGGVGTFHQGGAGGDGAGAGAGGGGGYFGGAGGGGAGYFAPYSPRPDGTGGGGGGSSWVMPTATGITVGTAGPDGYLQISYTVELAGSRQPR